MLTGNPFVDTGLGVLAAIANKESVNELQLKDMIHVHGNGGKLALWNSHMKSMSMIFTVNNVLSNPAIKDEKKRIQYYAKLTTEILNNISKDDVNENCECCGNEQSLNIDKLIRRSLVPLGYKDEKRYLGRDWFPLAGSLTSDAQALPAASRPLNLCATCLFSVHYLPLGVMLLSGKLVLFQSTDREFWYEIVKNQVTEVLDRIALGKYDTIGGKEGPVSAIRRLIAVMKSLRDDSKPGSSLFLWYFSNSGTGPDCKIEEIPNNALMFLFNCARHGLGDELIELIRKDRNPRTSLLYSISNEKDYYNLYPFKKFDGVSQKLFTLYQNNIRNIPIGMLETAYTIAKELGVTVDKKTLEILGKDLEKNFSGQNLIRKTIISMINSKKLNTTQILEYITLSGKISVNRNLWLFIKYYLHHIETEEFVNTAKLEVSLSNKKTLQEEEATLELLRWISSRIFNKYLKEKGVDRFRKEVLDRFGTGKINSSWLRNQFIMASEDYDGLNNEIWTEIFVFDGRERTFDVLFIFRALWTEWSREKTPIVMMLPTFKNKNESKLDLHITEKSLINKIAFDLLYSKGTEKYGKYILKALRTGRLNLGFIRKKFIQYDNKYKDDDIWDLFLRDKDGNKIPRTRMFQINILFSNINSKKISI